MKSPAIGIADISAKLTPARRTPKRVSDLAMRLVRDFQCPHCRESDVRSVLVPVPSAGDSSILRCYFCGEDFTAPDRK
jgi:transcription elongation factor Elf1